MTVLDWAPAPPLPLARRAHVEQVMGLPVSVLLRGPADGPQAVAAVRAFFTDLHRADATFSTYRPDSEVSRYNRGELADDAASDDLVDVLRTCVSAERMTGGLFSAGAAGSAQGLLLDPSGVVKAWAVERASKHLSLPGVDYCVNAGGDVLTRCLPGRAAWRVGVEDPTDRSRVLAVQTVRNGAVATSGTAARGAHLVDPRTGERPARLGSVTVTGPSLLVADVLATAAFIAGDAAARLVSRFPGYALV